MKDARDIHIKFMEEYSAAILDAADGANEKAGKVADAFKGIEGGVDPQWCLELFDKLRSIYVGALLDLREKMQHQLNQFRANQ